MYIAMEEIIENIELCLIKILLDSGARADAKDLMIFKEVVSDSLNRIEGEAYLKGLKEGAERKAYEYRMLRSTTNTLVKNLEVKPSKD